MPAVIRLLGPLEVLVDDHLVPADRWRRKRPLDLMRRLALASGHTSHREELIDALWPDKDLDAGANNLNRAVHDLRRILGEGRVITERGLVRLSGDVEVDVTAFEQAVLAGDLERAVGLYRGDLCPDDPYGDAIAPRREALRHRFVDAALVLARQQADSGPPDAAIATYRRLLDIDPIREDAHRALMRVLARAGRRQDALAQFAACTRALREGLDAAPSPETLRLREELLRGAPAEAPARPADWRAIARRLIGTDRLPPLRGRGAALAELESFVREGQGVLLLLGEAGVGKTRMVVEAARLGDEAGAYVLAGAACDVGDPVPYQPFVEAWREVGADDIPFLDTPDGPDAKLRLYQAVESSLRALAGQRPVLLIVEDLHWLDESSLHLFHYLARSGRTRPWRLVATGREEEVSPGSPLHTLTVSMRRERLLRRILLERLDRPATAEQLRDLLGGPAPDDVIASTWALSAGNPLFTEEVVRARAAGGGGDVPADLSQTIRARVARLGSAAGDFLLAASVLGPRFTFDAAAEVSGLGDARALDALEAGLAACLIDEDPAGYRFRHALVREALYQGLSRPRRALLHRAAAASLEQRTADAHEELAFHYREGGDLSAALPHLVAAGRRAARRLGMREAVNAFEQALAVMDELGLPPGPERFNVLDRCGRARLALSDIEPCVADFDRAASLVGPDGWRPTSGQRARAWRLAALALLTGGQLDEARRRLEQAVEVLAGAADDPEWPNVLYHLAQLHWHEGDYARAYEIAERSLAAAERHADAGAIARGYEMLALACHTLGRWKEGLAFEDSRQRLVGAPVDVAQSFDVHL